VGTVKQRLQRLEEQAQVGKGKIVVVKLAHADYTPMTPEEEAEARAAAEAEAGPDGDVLEVHYVDDWRGSDGQSEIIAPV